MVEKHTQPVDVSEELGELVEYENRSRELEPGFAVDAENTECPEDAIFARQLPDGSFEFSASIVEASLLDRGGHTVTQISDALAKGESPPVKLPHNRGSFSFALNAPMPSLSLIGNFHPEQGMSNLDLVRTSVNPNRFYYGDTDLSNPDEDVYSAWLETKLFAQAFRRHERSKASSSSSSLKAINDQDTVHTFANVLNTGIAILSNEAEMPQLIRKHPVVNRYGDKEIVVSQYSASPEILGEEGYDSLSSGIIKPHRGLVGWINMVNITYFMDNHESLLNIDQTEAIARWLSEEAEARRQERYLGLGEFAIAA